MAVEVEPRQLTIAAGQTASVELRLALAVRSAREVGLGRRALRVELSPVLRSPETTPKSWVLTGLIKSRVTLDALSLSFGDSPVQGEGPVTRKVVATAHVPLQRLEAKVRADMATVRVVPHPNGTHFDLLISPLPSLRPGRFDTDVTVYMVDAQGQDQHIGTLPISGCMQPEIRPLPAHVLLGILRIGEIAQTVVVLQGPKDAEFTVEHIEVDSPDLAVHGVKADGVPEGRAFQVVQQVIREGEHSSLVRFRIRRRGMERVTVAMEVRYRGTRVLTSSPPGNEGGDR